MHTQRAIFKIATILYILWATASFAYAGNNAGMIISSRGENIFERSDVRMAVDHFCRMLSIDPGNRTVRENLNKIVSHPELTAIQRSDVLQLENHLHFIENLQKRIEYLTSKRNVLRDQLIESGHARETLIKELYAVRNNISASQESVSYPKQSSFDRRNPLVIINDLLAKEEMQLSLRVRVLQDQYDRMKSFNEDQRYAASRYPVQEAADAEIPIQLSPVKEEKTEKTDVEKFKKELGALYVQLDHLEQRAGKNDGKVCDLENQVVDLSLRLSETQIELQEKAAAVDSLTAQLTDIEQRFVLGQRIIHEKDEAMRSLQDELQQLRLESESRMAKQQDTADSKDKDLKVMNGFLGLYRQGLGDARRIIAQKNGRVKSLEKELQGLQKRIALQKDRRGQGRQARVAEKDWALFEQKLNELKGILEIYKGKLSDETKAAREKAASINALEKQLTALENQLGRKNEALVKTQDDLRDLEDQLANMKQELLKLRGRSTGDGPQGGGVDSQVRELQSKFRDINDFLLENLRDSDRIKSHQVGE